MTLFVWSKKTLSPLLSPDGVTESRPERRRISKRSAEPANLNRPCNSTSQRKSGIGLKPPRSCKTARPLATEICEPGSGASTFQRFVSMAGPSKLSRMGEAEANSEVKHTTATSVSRFICQQGFLGGVRQKMVSDP